MDDDARRLPWVPETSHDGLAWVLADPSQAPPLLDSKLRTPRLRPNSLARPRLFDRLDSGTQRPVTSVSAPAGYGKTTLLSEWAARSARLVSWLALDHEDNEPTRFWAYFTAAVRRAHSEIGTGAWAHSCTGSSTFDQDCLMAFLNEVESLGEDLVLILDDYHLITATEIQDALSFVVEHLPRGLHLVLASRTTPSLPLARLRARGWLCEIGAADLAFTSKETNDFFDGRGLPKLESDELALLHRRTEGWAAGLELAALTLEASGDAAAIDSLLQKSSHMIAEYLTEEVLRSQPAEIRDFLLRTSVLQRFTAPLCDVVLQKQPGSSSTVLETLERRNLFLVPLDDAREWFRYHPIFAELLRAQLERSEPAALPAILSRASQWYEARGYYLDAIHCSRLATDVSRTVDLVTSSRHLFIEDGQFGILFELLEQLPEHLVESRPELMIARAWALTPRGRFSEAYEALQTAAALIDRPAEGAPGAPTDARDALMGEVFAARAMMDAFTNHRAGVRRHSELALEWLPAERRYLRALMQICRGWALKIEACTEEARLALNKALIIGGSSKNLLPSALAKYYLACVASREGKLHEAAATLRDVLTLTRSESGEELPLRGPVHVSLGVILYEWNELDEAERHLRLGLELSQRWHSHDALLEGHFGLGWLLFATGREDEAVRVMDEILDLQENIASGRPDDQPSVSVSPFITHLPVAYARAWYAKSAKNVRALGYDWANEILHEADVCTPSGSLALSLQHVASILVIQGRISEAQEVIKRLLPELELHRLNRQVVEMLVVSAMASTAEGDSGGALVSLSRALALAEPEGYARTFLDEGWPMRRLLDVVSTRGASTEYANRLLKLFSAVDTVMPLDTAHQGPLSARELQVLRLVAAGLTSAQAADRLVVSLHTVKAHLRSIHEKLEVHTRLQAVQRARELQLL